MTSAVEKGWEVPYFERGSGTFLRDWTKISRGAAADRWTSMCERKDANHSHLASSTKVKAKEGGKILTATKLVSGLQRTATVDATQWQILLFAV